MLKQVILEDTVLAFPKAYVAETSFYALQAHHLILVLRNLSQMTQ